MGAGNALKETRGNESQLQLSMELNVSRETISAYETERAKIPKDVSQKIMQKFDDPFYAMTVASEYTAGSWVSKLNGENIDLHRASVKEKSIEELEEAITKIKKTCLANKPQATPEEKRDELKKLLIECIDVIVCLGHFVAVICKEYGISWLGIWREHRKKLKERGYLKERDE